MPPCFFDFKQKSAFYDAEPEDVRNYPVLVVGAGGLGCEIVKNLALDCFTDIHIIDMDTIDVSNLNRQFLFREKDVGRPKAQVAAEFVSHRVPLAKVTAHCCRIQDKETDFYRNFCLIICGLDSVEARRWMNTVAVGLEIPLIDGGTEGLKGHARVVYKSACCECSLGMHPVQRTFPMCTIANTPRLPEHCVSWAMLLEFPKSFSESVDGDDPNHLQWIYQKALERATEFNISGVTYFLTQGVVKNIIPAVASTNAVIAAVCTSEALKMATCAHSNLNNYFMYIGTEKVYTHTFELEKKQDCIVCGVPRRTIHVSGDCLVKDFLIILQNDLNLSLPSLTSPMGSIYMQSPAALELATRPNLNVSLFLFLDDSHQVFVTDSTLPVSLTILIE